ncbi:MAG: hypothetical protein H6P98_1819 [Candidatus Aminicenantes bacterium]|jgi:uncharacterized protein YdhG (YjbR/CyaY superfamily)|nr:hypothetical protein [Candidatus Aminicenantes bacterium]
MLRPKYKSVDEYIASFPEDTQVILKTLRRVIKGAAPQAEEAISYGIPTFKLKGNLVHFAAFKNHIGFYPASSGIVAFKKELFRYKRSKGTVQFPIDKPIPFNLVKKIVRYRVKENLSLSAEKPVHFARGWR